MLKFPDNFLWGSATSATQIEGGADLDGKGKNVWDYWYEKEPYKFNDLIGPKDASKFYLNYKDDIKLLKKTGHNSFRTSISWSRLLPNSIDEVNEKAVEYYRDMFKRIKDEGITLFVNLFHFDQPMYIQDKGGWTSKEVVDDFARYAKTCFTLFGDLVDRWFTFNEPIVHVEMAYLYQYHFPMEIDPKKAIQAAFNTQLASARAIKEFKKINENGKIGIVLNLTPAYPRSTHPNDIKAAENANLFAVKSFLDPSVLGYYPKKLVDIVKENDILPIYTQEELDDIKNNTVDFLGVNYYQPLRVKENPYVLKEDAIFFPENYYTHYNMPGRRMNEHRGWEIYPEAIYDIAIDLKDNYKNIEWLISENGMGVANEEKFKKNGQIKDDYRIDFYKEHLEYLHKAIKEGSNCIGYHVWTFIDCWSWLNSYKNRYGLVELDLKTGDRNIKKSGEWFKTVCENNGF